jgi:hypothetical protein
MVVFIAAQRCIRPVNHCFYLVTTLELAHNPDNLSAEFIVFAATINFFDAPVLSNLLVQNHDLTIINF